MPLSRHSSLSYASAGPSSGNGRGSPAPTASTTRTGRGASKTIDVLPSPTSSIGRSTPQPAVLANSAAVGANRPGSASAVNRRRSEQATVSSPVEPHFPHTLVHHHHNHHNHHPHSAVFENDTGSPGSIDDEVDKGHGIGQRASASGRWTPTLLSNMLRRAEGRFSPVSTFNHTSPSAPSATSPHTAAHSTGSPLGFVASPTGSSPHKTHLSAEPEEVGSGLEDGQGRRTPARYRSEAAGAKLGLLMEQPSFEQPQKQKHQQPQQHAPTQPSSAAGSAFGDSSRLPAGGYYNYPRSSRSQHPLSHAHKLSIASSASSHSIQMHSPQMASHSRHASLQKAPLQPSPILAPSGNASPLVIPQARRGAVNLRRSGRRKRPSTAGSRRKGATSHAVPIHVQVIRLIRLFFWAMCHPLGAFRSGQRFIAETARSTDQAFRDPRTGARVWRPAWLGAYIPLLIWLVVSLSSTFTVLIWHTEVFQALDRLSTYLQSLGLLGRVILGVLIFLTTFPPLPLYSTLIILCGFSFGLVQGFIISYIAALSGAIVVFLLSRSLLKGWMVKLLNQSGGLKKVVRAIEKRPKLLFLVRLAPYPYNLMNTLLASSPTLTFKTYTVCTALALPKLLVHCGLGTTIKNFAAYNGAASVNSPPDAPLGGTEQGGKAPPMIGSDLSAADLAKAGETAELIKHVFGFVGVGLCVGIFLYLFSVARKAVDEELDGEEDGVTAGAEEYELMLGEEDEGVDADSMDELEHDDLSIAGPALPGDSSEGSRYDEGSSSQRTSSQAGHSGSYSPRINERVSASDATLVDGGRSGMLSTVKKTFGAGDGTTPLFLAPMGEVGGGGGASYQANGASYFGGWNGTSTGASATPSTRPYAGVKRYMSSQASLADSIVEMEKHANAAMDQDDDVGGPYDEQQPLGRHDISIEVTASSAPASRHSTIKGRKSTPHSYEVEDDSTSDEEGMGADERRRLVKQDRERASRRSQMGYEEQQIGST